MRPLKFMLEKKKTHWSPLTSLGRRPLNSARGWQMPPGTPALSACTAQGMWRPSRMKVKTHQDERTSSFQAWSLGTVMRRKTLADPSFSGSLPLSHTSFPAFLAKQPGGPGGLANPNPMAPGSQAPSTKLFKPVHLGCGQFYQLSAMAFMLVGTVWERFRGETSLSLGQLPVVIGLVWFGSMATTLLKNPL